MTTIKDLLYDFGKYMADSFPTDVEATLREEDELDQKVELMSKRNVTEVQEDILDEKIDELIDTIKERIVGV